MKNQRTTHTRQRMHRLLAFLTVLLLAPSLAGCDDPNMGQEIDITLRSDYSGLADAINGTGQSLSQKLALIETVLQNGFTNGQNALEMIQKAIASLSGSAADKLAAIETAVKSQAVGLETKLALIEAAVTNGLADATAQRALLQQALESLSGTTDERLQAIETTLKSGALGLGTKLELIASALENSLTDNEEALALIQQAIESLGGTAEDKLAAIKEVVQSQTTRVETKLAAIEAAVANGFADAQAGAALIREAIESLEDTLTEPLAALETVVQSQTTSLETRLAAIEAAVTQGLVDVQAGQELIQKAIASLGSDLSGQLASLCSAVASQTTSLETKLALIEQAVKDGATDGETGYELIQQAIASLGGTMEEKLASIETAVKDQNTTLGTKLAAIETAVKEGFIGETEALGLIQTAVNSLSGDVGEKLAAIENAISNPQTGLAAKLAAIETAVKDGFATEADKQQLIKDAIDKLKGTAEQKLGAIDTAILNQTVSLEGKFGLIQGALNTGLGDANTALGQIKDAVNSLKSSVDGDAGLIEKIGEIVSKLGTIDTALNGNVTTALTGILGAIAGLKDYTEILSAIQQALESMIPIPPTLDFSEEYVESSEVMMLPNDVLFIHYYVSSETDFKVTVAPSDDITATVCPDPNQPLEGDIKLETGSTVTNGKTRVVVTVTNDGGSISSTLAITEAYFKPIAPFTDITDTIHLDFAGQTLELKYKTNLDCSKPEVPDTLRNEDVPWLEVLSQDQTDDITTIQVKLLPNLGHIFRTTSVTVKETRYHHRSLEFIIKQKNDKVIEFEDGDLEAKIISKGVDTNFDNSISMSEAQAVTSLYALFGDDLTNGTDYISFDEFQYFTGITTIPEGSFNNWTKLRSITLPESITKIDVDFRDVAGGSTAKLSILQNCPRLASIKGKFATADQKALIYKQEGASTSKLVKVVEVIGSNEEIELPEGIDTIARYAFYGSSYKMVKLPSSLKVIGESAFEYSMIETLSLPMSGPDPEKDTCCVTTIYDNTFAHCHSLKTIYGAYNKGQLRVFAAGHALYRDTTMYAYALGCSDDKLIIPDELDIRRLPDHLFEMVDQDNQLVPGRCYLEVIALPSSINHIGARTFYGLVTLQRLFFHGSTPPAKCGQNAFDEIGDRLKILVPSGAEINSFATALHVDLSRFTTWQEWNP